MRDPSPKTLQNSVIWNSELFDELKPQYEKYNTKRFSCSQGQQQGLLSARGGTPAASGRTADLFCVAYTML